MEKDLPKTTLSPEEKAAYDAVLQIGAMIKDLLKYTDVMHKAINKALNVTKSCHWPEICEDTRGALTPVIAAMKKRSASFKEKYKLD